MDYICFFSLAKCCKNCQLGAQNETKITKKMLRTYGTLSKM